MKAVLLSTGETVFVLNNTTDMGKPYLTVLFPFVRQARSGAHGDVRSVRRERVRIVKDFIGGLE